MPSNSRTETKSSEGGMSNLHKQNSNSEDGLNQVSQPNPIIKTNSNHNMLDKKLPDSKHNPTKKVTSDFIIKSKNLIEKMEMRNSPIKDLIKDVNTNTKIITHSNTITNPHPHNKLSNSNVKSTKVIELNNKPSINNFVTNSNVNTNTNVNTNSQFSINQNQSLSDLKKQFHPPQHTGSETKQTINIPHNSNNSNTNTHTSHNSTLNSAKSKPVLTYVSTVGTPSNSTSTPNKISHKPPTSNSLLTQGSKIKMNLNSNPSNSIIRTSTHNNLQNQILNVNITNQ